MNNEVFVQFEDFIGERENINGDENINVNEDNPHVLTDVSRYFCMVGMLCLLTAVVFTIMGFDITSPIIVMLVVGLGFIVLGLVMQA